MVVLQGKCRWCNLAKRFVQPALVVEIDPMLRFTQEISWRIVALPIDHGQFGYPNKALCTQISSLAQAEQQNGSMSTNCIQHSR